MNKTKHEILLGSVKNYIISNNYHMDEKEEENCTRLDISNMRESTIFKIFNNGTIQIQGRANSLKEEFQSLKDEIEENILEQIKSKEKIPSHVRYRIITQEIQQKIKDNLLKECERVKITEQNNHILYKLSVSNNTESVHATQFTNGTLLLQGKTGSLLDNICELIEKIGKPSENEVIVRFLSNNESALEEMSKKYTPQLLNDARRTVEKKLGEVFKYLSSYNLTMFIVSECLLQYQLQLPEHSVVVMPASKGFEGYAKQIMEDIGLVTSSNIPNLSPLTDKNNTKRINVCSRDSKIDKMLLKLHTDITVFRHFLMHSDDSTFTTIDTFEEAEEKIENIYNSIKQTFSFFNSIFNLI